MMMGLSVSKSAGGSLNDVCVLADADERDVDRVLLIIAPTLALKDCSFGVHVMERPGRAGVVESRPQVTMNDAGCDRHADVFVEMKEGDLFSRCLVSFDKPAEHLERELPVAMITLARPRAARAHG